MKSFKAIGKNVVGTMVDAYGEKTTTGGIVIQEKNADANSIRPRWFEVTHVGPDNKDFVTGQYVLVKHGRWSREFSVESHGETKLHLLDTPEILAIADELPASH